MVDHNFEWEKTYAYRLTIVTLLTIAADNTQAEVEGDDTPSVNVFAHDTFPPAVPGGLQAVASEPGDLPSVDLVWAPNTDTDLAGYNVYRTGDTAPWSKLNTDLVRAPAFRDQKVQAGKTYHYSVSAVDLRGNESEHSPDAIETVP
jgi:fibronectin type 3 domain-containing protein